MTRPIPSTYAFELLCAEAARRREPFTAVYRELEAEGCLPLEAGGVLTKQGKDYRLEGEAAAQSARPPDQRHNGARPIALSSHP